MDKPRFGVDWEVAGKLVEVLVDDAAALLVNLDLGSYKHMDDFYMTQALGDHPPGVPHWQAHLHELSRLVEDRFIAKSKVMQVIKNHIDSGTFVERRYVQISLDEAKRRQPYTVLEENREYYLAYVDLVEFGVWARSVGYELSPKFPIRKRGGQENRSQSRSSREVSIERYRELLKTDPAISKDAAAAQIASERNLSPKTVRRNHLQGKSI